MRIEATNPVPPPIPPARNPAGETEASFISLVNQFLASQAENPTQEGFVPLWNTQVLEEILREEAALEETRQEVQEERDEADAEERQDDEQEELAAGDYQPGQESAAFEAGGGGQPAGQDAEAAAPAQTEANPDLPFDFGSLQAWIHSEKFRAALEQGGEGPHPWHQLLEEAERQPLGEADIGFLVPLLLQQYPALTSESYCLLEELLSALLAGQALTIDQHLAVYLDQTGWKVIFTVLPPRFFKGLLAPLASGKAGGPGLAPLDCRHLLEGVVFQRGLTPSDTTRLQELYAASAGRLSASPLPEWLPRGHFNPSLNIRFLLETLQQFNLVLPGPVGQIQALALRYVHHGSALAGLFHLSQRYLHALALSPQEIRFLAKALFEHCFPPLASRETVLPLLEKVLTGQPLPRPGRIHLLQTGSQVLRYLPHHCVHAEWQALLEFIYTHPGHIEDPGLWSFA